MLSPIHENSNGSPTSNSKEGYFRRKKQRTLTSVEPWFERWKIKINEDETQA